MSDGGCFVSLSFLPIPLMLSTRCSDAIFNQQLVDIDPVTQCSDVILFNQQLVNIDPVSPSTPTILVTTLETDTRATGRLVDEGHNNLVVTNYGM